MSFLRFFTSAALVTSLGSIAIACGSKTTDGNPSLEAACTDYASGIRSYLTRCTGSAAGFDESRLKLLCAEGVRLEGSSITPQFLAGCSSALSDLSCDSIFGDVAACKPPPGKLATGAACVSDEQCSTSYCLRAGESCGVCTAPVPIGGSCTGPARCVDGAGCVSGKCVADVKSGAGGGCDFNKNESCLSGFFCDYTSKTCVAYGALGAACSPTSPCHPDLACGSSKTCVEPTVVGEGKACGDIVRCDRGLVCDGAASKCVKIAVVPPGGDCSGPFARCEQGSCLESTHTCPLIIPDGEACSASDESKICAFGSECVGGRCLLPIQIACH